ncbi:leucyl aminopeptidase [Pseudahrensia aquimaris]|uniref:Probable cytosol aminopeptidase n=1 Tax=Pseudahrensia aquimaris TaxID=744461 RepID=A0ABW3FB49_9HYPH
MPVLPQPSFTTAALPTKGSLVVFCDRDNVLSASAKALDKDGLITRAIKAEDFKGSFGKALSLLQPAGTDLDRIVLMGLGKMTDMDEYSWLKLGGKLVAQLGGIKKAYIALERPDGQGMSSHEVTQVALGAKLGAYRFVKYKSDKAARKEDKFAMAFHTKTAAAAKKAWGAMDGVGDGVLLARNLVNEPANTLTPIEFAKRAKELEKLGCKVDVLDEKAMKKLKMNALLGVAQGSRNAPRMAIIRWNGGKAKDKPIAFIGKGVTFDTGGVSLKPAGGMEDMKGDMGGAAAVTGLMHALAARKAKANVIGIIACVENMNDGNAQRPGDIVTSMSGQTIEVLNTDAEGRLVLADALWYCREKYDPQFMINLATLTGAILVALGSHHAGLFSNNDELAERLTKAGTETQEKLWRMPLGPEYDKMIDSKNADMKNIGGRHAGSITAGQFLQRFVKSTPWAHLDVAGTAMGSNKNEINQSWASGYGVRLLDRLVANNYEG